MCHNPQLHKYSFEAWLKFYKEHLKAAESAEEPVRS